MTTKSRKAFVRALAEFLVGNQGEMSIRLQMGTEDAKRWRDLRLATPLFGYPTVDEAEKQLAEWLLVSED